MLTLGALEQRLREQQLLAATAVQRAVLKSLRFAGAAIVVIGTPRSSLRCNATAAVC